ncbi:hypothetical protein IT072_13810 [Leifsonia sp. ZF2019]|uniref:hypothetical protein n=1 Tax=Leifsonia sp. ZF2019 TaxID=2781978 RepID=UPI001CBC24F0|nr:hypothetical protein [Leifsonia sp. ZF2019]UAJ78334.1 hypothetical protein IT072_13810 [Leifsonia sp. ZF2019]
MSGYQAGQRLESKYNGSIITLERVDADGGVKASDSAGRIGSTTVTQLDRLYQPVRGEG